MAIPNKEKRYRALQAKNIEKEIRKNNVNCKRQFPDCPDIPNENNCQICPHWKRVR
jgi:hypothetical protein